MSLVEILVRLIINVLHAKARACCFMVKIILIFSCSSLTFAANDEQAVDDGESIGTPPVIGNFALDNSQQPSPLISFGQTIIDRNQVQLYLQTISPYHTGGAFANANVTLAYGISDSTALTFNYPLRSSPALKSLYSIQLLDISLQLEHAFYTSGNSKLQDQATIVGAITLPTHESRSIDAIVGYGVPSYFLGTTFNRTYVDWLVFTSPGVLITTTSNHIRIGSQILYQAGVGHNILYVSDESILFGLVEFDGQYAEKNVFYGYANHDSGGNVIFLTPSVSFSTPHTITQVGVGFPVVQNLNGNQIATDYFVAATFTWTIA